MALVRRAPLTNFRSMRRQGAVRMVVKEGPTVTMSSDGRPDGTPDARPDVKRAYKGVGANERTNFGRGTTVRRNSVFQENTSGTSGANWGGPRRRRGI